MTREEILEQLRAAKRAHTQWLSDALALIAGLGAEPEQVPVSHHHCEFGQWYYGLGAGLASLPAYQAIEGPHQELHDIYAQVFDLLFAQSKGSLLNRVFGPTGLLGGRRRERAKALMQDLLAASRTLIEAISALEQEVQALPESELPPQHQG